MGIVYVAIIALGSVGVFTHGKAIKSGASAVGKKAASVTRPVTHPVHKAFDRVVLNKKIK